MHFSLLIIFVLFIFIFVIFRFNLCIIFLCVDTTIDMLYNLLKSNHAENYMVELAKVLRILRIKNNETSFDMAKKLHLSPSHLSAIEHGRRAIPKDMKHLIVSAYKLTDEQIEKVDKAIAGIYDKTNLTTLSFNRKEKDKIVKYRIVKSNSIKPNKNNETDQ